MTQYRTADGKIFADENEAVIHSQVLDYQKQGLEQTGKPYEFNKIDRSDDDGKTWY